MWAGYKSLPWGLQPVVALLCVFGLLVVVSIPIGIFAPPEEESVAPDSTTTSEPPTTTTERVVITTTTSSTTTTTAPPTTTTTRPDPTTTTRPVTTVQQCTDPAGDLVIEGQGTSGQPPFADLRGVSVDRSSGRLVVRFTTAEPVRAGDIPAIDTAFYYVQTADEPGGVGYQIGLSLGDDGWLVDVTDLASLFADDGPSVETIEVDPILDGRSITASIPLDSLADLSADFYWYGGTETGDRLLHQDRCPGGGGPTAPPSAYLRYRG